MLNTLSQEYPMHTIISQSSNARILNKIRVHETRIYYYDTTNISIAMFKIHWSIFQFSEIDT